MYVSGAKLEKGSVNLVFIPVFKPRAHKLDILRHFTNILHTCFSIVLLKFIRIKLIHSWNSFLFITRITCNSDTVLTLELLYCIPTQTKSVICIFNCQMVQYLSMTKTWLSPHVFNLSDTISFYLWRLNNSVHCHVFMCLYNCKTF